MASSKRSVEGRREIGQYHAIGKTQAKPRTRARAEVRITAQRSEVKPCDQTASPALLEIHLSETFTCDIDRELLVWALEVQRDDRSACLVSVQRFRGTLGGREGTFVLDVQERQDQDDMGCRSRIGDR